MTIQMTIPRKNNDDDNDNRNKKKKERIVFPIV